MERTPLDNGTILICSEGTNIYRFVSCCTPSDHVYRKPGGRTIRTLHAVWALHRPTKATALVAHWNSGPLTVLQIQFKKTLKLFHCLSLQDKRTLPPACILSTYMTMGGGSKPYLRSNLLHHTEDFLSHAYFQSTEHKCQLVCCNIAAF